MAYCTKTNLEQMFGAVVIRNLLDEDQSGVVDSDETGILTAAISSAEARINAKLAAKYSVPFDTAPDLIRDLAAQAAFYFLCLRAGRQIPQAVAVINHVDADLDELAKGKMSLSELGAASTIYSTDEGEAVFTRTKTNHSGHRVNADSGSMDTW